MKKGKLSEYGFDIKYEYRTYKNVGRDYGNRKTINRGFIDNCIRFFRKNFFNYNEKKYKFCNTYSQWEKHVIESILKDVTNLDDFLHFLIYQKRSAATFLEAIKGILIPIYIAILSMPKIMGINDIKSAFSVMIIIVVISTYIVYDASKKVEFYEDLIDVLKNLQV